MSKKCNQVLVPPRHTNEGKTIVVLGAPRGGTSLISGILRLMGVFMGDPRDRLGHQHEDPKFRADVPLADKILTIKDRNKQHPLWGWKFPSTIHFLTDVFTELRNPHIVVVYRNPFDVGLSSATRGGVEFTQKQLNVPINHYKKMHDVIDRVGPCPRIAYSHEAILKDADGFLSSLSEFCGIVLTDEQRAECLEFMDPNSGYKRIKPVNKPNDS
jgi:hypothetical protein